MTDAQSVFDESLSRRVEQNRASSDERATRDEESSASSLVRP